jgi:hypothetical protein
MRLLSPTKQPDGALRLSHSSFHFIFPKRKKAREFDNFNSKFGGKKDVSRLLNTLQKEKKRSTNLTPLKKKKTMYRY